LEQARAGHVTPLYSAAMLDEWLDVFSRPYIQQKYHIRPDDVEALFLFLQARGEPVAPQEWITDCRDPKDNKFLEAALAGQADCIISGDLDLCVRHPWRGIEIMTPVHALERLAVQ